MLLQYIKRITSERSRFSTANFYFFERCDVKHIYTRFHIFATLKPSLLGGKVKIIVIIILDFI